MPRTITPEHRVRLALLHAEERIAAQAQQTAVFAQQAGALAGLVAQHEQLAAQRSKAQLMGELAMAYGEGANILADGTIADQPAPPEPPAPPEQPAPEAHPAPPERPPGAPAEDEPAVDVGDAQEGGEEAR